MVVLDSGETRFALNERKLFTPASTTKLLTAAAALDGLGADFRFTTRVYRTGGMAGDAVIGDLVLAASGDPNLSNRIAPDGTLRFMNEDHTYANVFQDAEVVPGDPLQVIDELADQVVARGIRRVQGDIRVDATRFAPRPYADYEGPPLSAVSVNDNVIDVFVEPGPRPGAPAVLTSRPRTSYVSLTNRITTAEAGTPVTIAFSQEGSGPVVVTGKIPVGRARVLRAYFAPDPAAFASTLLCEALERRGVTVLRGTTTDGAQAAAAAYTPDRLVATHVSPPFSEEVKVTLKVSHNLHAMMLPLILAAEKTGRGDGPAGLRLERAFFERVGMPVDRMALSSGAGGSQGDQLSPSAVTTLLRAMARHPQFKTYYEALPIMGVDGTLAKHGKGTAAEGRVHAKTGTYVWLNGMNGGAVLLGKGLAGYLTTNRGERMAFAIYLNKLLFADLEQAAAQGGDVLARVAAAIISDDR